MTKNVACGRGFCTDKKVSCHLRLAEVRNVHDLKVHDARAHKGRHGGGHDLRGEGVALRDLEVVCQLQIVGKVEGVCRGHVSATEEFWSVARSWRHHVAWTDVRCSPPGCTYPKHLKKFMASAFPGCHPPPMNSARTLQVVNIGPAPVTAPEQIGLGLITHLNSTSIPVVALMIPVGMRNTIASARPKKTTPTLV